MDGFVERRIGMVEQQLRPNQVTDKRLLAAMGAVPRERFLPEALRGFAYMDKEIEVFPASENGAARFLLSPLVQARLIQLAEISAEDTVLDVGCATGYSAAILGRLATRVTGVEPESGLAETADTNLKAVRAGNVEIVETAFQDPPANQGPFDAILIEGSVPAVPDHLLHLLKQGGRLVTVLTDAPDMRWGRAVRYLRIDGQVSGVLRFDASAAPLPGLAREPAFAL